MGLVLFSLATLLRADGFQCHPYQSLPHDSTIFFDTSAALDFDDILTIQFTEPYQAEALGLTRDAVWIKTVFNPKQACLTPSWNLQFGNPYLDYIDVYILQNNRLLAHYELGDRRSRPADLSPQRLPAVPLSPYLDTDTADELVIFARLASQNSISTDMVFITQAQIQAKDAPIIIVSAFIAASLLLIILFSVILFFVTRHIAALYFIILVSSYSFVLATIYGWMHYINLPSDPWVVIVQPIIILSFILLSNALLNIQPNYPRIYLALLVIGLGLIFLTVTGAIFDDLQTPLRFVHSLAIVSLLTILVLSLLMVRQNLIARFYFAMFGIMVIAIVIRILAIYGLVPANFVMANLFAFAIAFQLIVLFFIMLGYYYRNFIKLQTELQQLQLEQELVSQRKLFLRLLSHEFMTPLAIGSAAGRNLADDLDDLAKQNVAPHIVRQMQQDLHTQQRARQRLQDLVNQCLEADYEVNRFEEGYTTLAQFSRIFYQSLNKIDQRPRIIVEWDFEPESLSEQHSTLKIKGDAEPLVMALNMVVNNALKYSKPDQNVIITVSLDKAQLIIAVRDFGIGFDQDNEITQAFKRGRNTQSTSGLGLGLFISQEILQRYHGKLTIEPQQPGSLVSLSIPLDSK
ncbi:sensor histidine kinase [Thiomicrospira sp. ALE5]|uniref:sensor histidine kinase n=1 Tax=Thiomicrospira sp. ALE5 TaxID=748650 RepID=UPI0008ECE130|nr:sensor histidine kinase [Thiomicrospira sp. ALE5]SFR60755.1 Signal transduction histidine kinase [Thiomicrospira sp. ALE5]